jgi:acyl carrier protein
MTDLSDDRIEEVLATVTALLVTVVGEDFLLDTEVTAETSFNKDLELESIEFVALSELLQTHYGNHVDFVSWIGDMELEEIMILTVGQLVDHISNSLR